MAASNDIDSDIAILRGIMDGPDAGLATYLTRHPDLATVEAAREDLAEIIAGLEDVRGGRVVSHAEILKDMEARRRPRIQAAE